jgi:hypothetical protein
VDGEAIDTFVVVVVVLVVVGAGGCGGGMLHFRFLEIFN